MSKSPRQPTAQSIEIEFREINKRCSDSSEMKKLAEKIMKRNSTNKKKKEG